MLVIPRNVGIDAFQKSARALDRVHRHQRDLTEIRDCVELLADLDTERLADFLRNHDLVLGRDGHGCHTNLRSIAESYVVGLYWRSGLGSPSGLFVSLAVRSLVLAAGFRGSLAARGLFTGITGRYRASR